MRREPSSIGDYFHVFNRGNRRMPIVYDESDRWRFLKILRYFNDEYSVDNIFRCVDLEVKSGRCHNFERPKDWPPPHSLVKILSYSLMPNHFHLLLKEIIDGGVSRFMKKFADGFTKYINTKYDEVGSLFQGPYKRTTIKSEKTLQYTDVYIQIFNIFELYPGGLEKAIKEFDKAFNFVLEYQFCSLGESFGRRNLHIIDRDVLAETFRNLQEYKEFAREAITFHDIRKMINKEIENVDIRRPHNIHTIKTAQKRISQKRM